MTGANEDTKQQNVTHERDSCKVPHKSSKTLMTLTCIIGFCTTDTHSK